jgi:hypothetical protein
MRMEAAVCDPPALFHEARIYQGLRDGGHNEPMMLAAPASAP